MLPWKTIIPLQKEGGIPVYLQVANAIILEMKKGRIGPGVKLPGTRQLSELLEVHRKTIVKAYEELEAQEWIEKRPSQGTFTSGKLPEISPRKLASREGRPEKSPVYPAKTGFPVRINDSIRAPVFPNRHINGFHDGPDVRLTPLEELGRAYKSVLSRPHNLKYFSYVETAGIQKFREVLSGYLNASRGLQTSFGNIMVTRGTTMGLYLLSRVLFEKGDTVLVGDTNYYYADHTFLHVGMRLVRVPVDEYGIDVDAIERVCRKKKVRAVYITSHHHYPTTVTLIAARRIRLLTLAEKYGFVIIEDDYDYDFHYLSSPILPLASADTTGMVIYVGTLSKTVAPSIRTGYVVAPQNLILEMGRLRQLVDSQGDPILELALAEMMEEGIIRRHMKKSLAEYRRRRDFLCDCLSRALGDVIEFKIPDGGMAIWAKFHPSVPIPPLTEKLRAQGLILPNGLIYNTGPVSLNSTRMGFAWMNEQEAEEAIGRLETTIRKKGK